MTTKLTTVRAAGYACRFPFRYLGSGKRERAKTQTSIGTRPLQVVLFQDRKLKLSKQRKRIVQAGATAHAGWPEVEGIGKGKRLHIRLRRIMGLFTSLKR